MMRTTTRIMAYSLTLWACLVRVGPRCHDLKIHKIKQRGSGESRTIIREFKYHIPMVGKESGSALYCMWADGNDVTELSPVFLELLFDDKFGENWYIYHLDWYKQGSHSSRREWLGGE